MAILLATSYIMQLDYVPPIYVTTTLFILASSYEHIFSVEYLGGDEARSGYVQYVPFISNHFS